MLLSGTSLTLRILFSKSGKSLDCGDKPGYAKVFVQYGLNDAKSGADFRKVPEAMLGYLG